MQLSTRKIKPHTCLNEKGAGGLFLSDSSWILLTKIVEQRRCDNAAALKLLDATADEDDMNDSHLTLHHQAHSHTTLLLNVTNDDEAANITTGVLLLHSTGFFVMLFSFPDCSSSIIITTAASYKT